MEAVDILPLVLYDLPMLNQQVLVCDVMFNACFIYFSRIFSQHETMFNLRLLFISLLWYIETMNNFLYDTYSFIPQKFWFQIAKI